MLCVLILAAPLVARSADRDDFGRRASWELPTWETTNTNFQAWLASQSLAIEKKAELERVWSEPVPADATDMLDRLSRVAAALDPRFQAVVDQCQSRTTPSSPPRFAILQDESVAPFVRHNLRLLLGQWLVTHALYDEAAEQLSGLQTTDVIDPATLLFHQSVVHHRLLEKDACLAKLSTLLEQESALPKRYATIARLMEADIKPLETDSLDEVARLMEDIQRRLNLARAGKRVRKQEDDVVAKLDKMIEELEKQQQQQQQQQQSGSAGGNQSGKPADDSTPMGGRGPGDVDQKKIGNQAGWGNLPPKEREEALQQISKDLPAHFREVIEEYFRKLANEAGER
jgi:hypothetical protein